jgi:hypothetical protein
MKPIDPSTLSLDYLLENEVITILSRDYVLECGIFGDDAELNWDECGYFTVDRDGIRFTGLAYEVYDHKDMKYYPFFTTDFQDGTLLDYAYYVNGLQDGVEVEFYPSGAVHSYSVFDEGRLVGKSYEWYENGRIKKYIDLNLNQRVEFDKQGKITKQGKV